MDLGIKSMDERAGSKLAIIGITAQQIIHFVHFCDAGKAGHDLWMIRYDLIQVQYCMALIR